MHVKNGFTLVELSIVLVIIGLLIGGILVAQSLVESARLNSFVRQIQQYDGVAALFKERYDALPGDNDFLSYTGSHGTELANNGFINDTNANDDNFTGELMYYWEDLSLVGMLDKTYTNAGSGIVTEVNLPKSVFGENAGIMVGHPSDGGNHFQGEGNAYWISDFSDTQRSIHGGTCTDCNRVFTPAEALSIDKKLDDGLQDSGIVRAATAFEFNPNATGCISGSNYVAASSGAICSLLIKHLSQVGDY